MRKKILISIGVLIMLIGAALVYLNYRNRTLSPPGSAELSNAGLKVSLTYSRPSVRNRVIFGTAESGALQPYGQYWRLGANESTEVTFNTDVLFNGQPVKAGTYRMYAVPGPDSFDIALNKALGKWGAMEPDYSLDILKTKVPATKDNPVTEQHTITLSKIEEGISIDVAFEKVKFSIPVTAQ